MTSQKSNEVSPSTCEVVSIRHLPSELFAKGNAKSLADCQLCTSLVILLLNAFLESVKIATALLRTQRELLPLLTLADAAYLRMFAHVRISMTFTKN